MQTASLDFHLSIASRLPSLQVLLYTPSISASIDGTLLPFIIRCTNSQSTRTACFEHNKVGCASAATLHHGSSRAGAALAREVRRYRAAAYFVTEASWDNTIHKNFRTMVHICVGSLFGVHRSADISQSLQANHGGVKTTIFRRCSSSIAIKLLLHTGASLLAVRG